LNAVERFAGQDARWRKLLQAYVSRSHFCISNLHIVQRHYDLVIIEDNVFKFTCWNLYHR